MPSLKMVSAPECWVVEPVDDEVTLVEMWRVCGVEAVVLVTDMKGFAVLPGVLDPHSSATAEFGSKCGIYRLLT